MIRASTRPDFCETIGTVFVEFEVCKFSQFSGCLSWKIVKMSQFVPLFGLFVFDQILFDLLHIKNLNKCNNDYRTISRMFYHCSGLHKGRELVQLGRPHAKDASFLPLTEQHCLSVSPPAVFLDLSSLPPACSCCTASLTAATDTLLLM